MEDVNCWCVERSTCTKKKSKNKIHLRLILIKSSNSDLFFRKNEASLRDTSLNRLYGSIYF